jgi:hypothetical protein
LFLKKAPEVKLFNIGKGVFLSYLLDEKQREKDKTTTLTRVLMLFLPTLVRLFQ